MIDQAKFKELAAKWKSETGGYSTTIHKIDNHNYKEIINMGSEVVPYILKDLKTSPVWFPALRELTKENPVQPAHAGNTKKMAEDWIKWGVDRALI